jgi:starch phosphorylase
MAMTPFAPAPAPKAIAEALIDHLHYLQAKLPQHATRNDWYMALAVYHPRPHAGRLHRHRRTR